MRYLLLVLLLAGCATDGGLAARMRLTALLPSCVLICVVSVTASEKLSAPASAGDR
ncbi:hypothetical protein [Cupriavidus sp. AcVe19-6a]|uniref:hypothetical protein n=1 Tax=Cupriavidus sp. AcVe19-6a TaxID=2821358 RepID=UPI001AE54127|nr:hypothetical protein [Cupriavidus sp. AcVe19-6a]MBP0634921.1 hypothetical protein [Cupriavidus sp. AcVe19-6a]